MAVEQLPTATLWVDPLLTVWTGKKVFWSVPLWFCHVSRSGAVFCSVTCTVPISPCALNSSDWWAWYLFWQYYLEGISIAPCTLCTSTVGPRLSDLLLCKHLVIWTACFNRKNCIILLYAMRYHIWSYFATCAVHVLHHPIILYTKITAS